AERLADATAGRRPSPLHETPVLSAVVDDVPDDEEVAGQIELVDERDLALELRARGLVIRPVAITRADLRDAPQKRRLRLAGRHGIRRKAAAQVRQRGLEPVGQRRGTGQRTREIPE